MNKIISASLAIVSVCTIGFFPSTSFAGDGENKHHDRHENKHHDRHHKAPIAKFSCSTRGFESGEIAFYEGGHYTSKDGNGKYELSSNSFGPVYRIKSGQYADRSLLTGQTFDGVKRIYLISTKDEDRAGKIGYIPICNPI